MKKQEKQAYSYEGNDYTLAGKTESFGDRKVIAQKPAAFCEPSSLLVGCSAPMKQLFSVIKRVAPLNSSILITGATGTGKELVARAIHQCGPRVGAPFIDINCSAIPESLFEAEVFGHQRGTFTGAYETRRGLFEEASGGTVFLDEVDALGLPMQAKLLRVLQERQLRRVGGRENIPIDIRIIAATNRNLHDAVSKGHFRPDLFFRLRVVPLHLPELRERPEDIGLLVEHFLRRAALRYGTNNDGHQPRFSSSALQAMTAYSWPGNVRELENAIEYALAISNGTDLDLEDLPPEVQHPPLAGNDIIDHCLTVEATLAEVEKQYVLKMFERCRHNRVKTACALGIDRRTLFRKLKDYGVIANDDRTDD